VVAPKARRHDKNLALTVAYKAKPSAYFLLEIMKKTTLLLAICALAFTTAQAQTTPTTEVNTRANGTVRTTTTNPDGSQVVTKSGRTNTGEVIHAGKEGTKKVAHKTGHALKRGAQKTKNTVQKGSNKVAEKAKDIAD